MIPLDSPLAPLVFICGGCVALILLLGAGKDIGWRAIQGGALPGDVIVAVENRKVVDLESFYRATRKVDTNQAVLLDVDRRGQVMTMVLSEPNVDQRVAQNRGVQPSPAPVAGYPRH